MNIFIKKLSYDTKKADLQTAFEKFGTVENCNIVMDTVTKKSKGFGFVEMPDDAEANAAILALNNSKLDGRAIAVKEAKPKEESREVDSSERNDINERSSNDRRGNHRGSKNSGSNRKR
jgi:RNA recognition motif-containing protein